MTSTKTYNQRLFSGWMGLYHNRRFEWVKSNIERTDYKSVLEIGCYDCRLLEYIAPEFYCGIDSGTALGTGIEVAKLKYKDSANVQLIVGGMPKDIPERNFDVVVALETFEHIEPELVEPYLESLSKKVTGKAFFSVPVERGMPLIIASLSRLINRVPGIETYTPKEFLYAFAGRMDKVKRLTHKGFDERIFISQVSKYFNITKIESMFGPKALGLNLGTGIIAEKT